MIKMIGNSSRLLAYAWNHIRSNNVICVSRKKKMQLQQDYLLLLIHMRCLRSARDRERERKRKMGMSCTSQPWWYDCYSSLSFSIYTHTGNLSFSLLFCVFSQWINKNVAVGVWWWSSIFLALYLISGAKNGWSKKQANDMLSIYNAISVLYYTVSALRQ